MNIPLLHRLQAAGGSFVPLAALVGDSSSVRRDLDELAAFGFALEEHPYLGVAYRGPAARLCPDQIEWELGTLRIGRRVAVWNRAASTNDLAARASGSTANDGLVILAEEQTAGRGRRGRSWSAPARSAVLMSTLVFPPLDLAAPAWLTALGAVAVAEVVEAVSGGPARIKWPNDVRIAGRKVAGILVERGPGAVVGIGLNVNAAEADFPGPLRASATSLRLVTGGRALLDRSEVARALIRQLDAHYERGLIEGPGRLETSWRERLEGIGQMVRLETPGGRLIGRLLDASFAAGLLIAPGDGPPRRVEASEVLALAAETEPEPAG